MGGRNPRGPAQYAEHVKTLYKFYSVNEYSLDSLSRGAFFAPHYSKLNDPFDCQIDPERFLTEDNFVKACAAEYGPRTRYCREVMREHLVDGEFKPALRRRIREEIEHYREYVARHGIVALTGIRTNVLLWSHYADSHRGFCIAFDRNGANVLGQPDLCNTVAYIRKFDVSWFLDLFRERPGFFTSRAISTKSLHWKYEREWRLISEPANAYVSYGCDPKEIIFGANCSEADRGAVLGATRDWGIKYSQAVLSPQNFRIGFSRLKV
jgi:hypothetical protein